MSQIALVTGASSGFGRTIANELARAGHIAYASMRGTREKNANQAKDIAAYAKKEGVELRAIELDVQSDDSAAKAVNLILAEHGRIDILVHNAGHMVYGPSEAFTPDQLAELYDINVLGTPARQSSRASTHARREDRPHGLDLEHQRGGWRSAASGSVLRGEGGDGRLGRLLRERAGTIRHRELDCGAGRIHKGHEPLRECRSPG